MVKKILTHKEKKRQIWLITYIMHYIWNNIISLDGEGSMPPFIFTFRIWLTSLVIIRAKPWWWKKKSSVYKEKKMQILEKNIIWFFDPWKKKKSKVLSLSKKGKTHEKLWSFLKWFTYVYCWATRSNWQILKFPLLLYIHFYYWW